MLLLLVGFGLFFDFIFGFINKAGRDIIQVDVINDNVAATW